jgi:hypothetical protein
MTITSGETRSSRRAPAVTEAPAGPRRENADPLAGRYQYDAATGRWQWSPGLYSLLRVTPGPNPPTIEMLLAHLHPDEHATAMADLAACTRGVAFSAEQRFRRADGTEFLATVVGEPETDDAGTVTAVTGIVVAVPRRPAVDEAERVRALETEVAQLHTAMASRAQIEQAKGVLMLLTGFTEQACFDLLGHISSHTHRKVRDLAREITASAAGREPLPADIRAILHDACPPPPVKS